MMTRWRAIASGLHFRFLSLVVGVAVLLLAAQLATDTYHAVQNAREARLNEAMSVTNVIARSLEKQFDFFELDDIEEILVSVRKRSDIRQLSVVDRDLTFYLDGDLATSPVMAINSNSLHNRAMESGKTALAISGSEIEVAEPLLAGGSNPDALGFHQKRAIGSVLIGFDNPGLLEMLVPVISAKFYTVLPIILGGLLLAGRMVSQITAPLLGLSRTAQAIADGDFEQVAAGRGAREIRQLAEAFNRMVATIRTNIAQIYDLAYIDKITRLPNREFFRREIARSVERAERHGTSGALLFLDLDGFKRVNDTAGHDFGDRLLTAFSERITALVRQGDRMVSLDAARELIEADSGEQRGLNDRSNTFARLGGDEFTILLPEIREETDAAAVARRIIDALREPFFIDGKEITIGASIGIATFPRDGRDYQTLLKHSDMAMYEAKESGKNTFCFFSEELNRLAGRRMEIETDLRKALANGELELHYQPKINALNEAVTGLEALVRWNHPVKGMVSPGEFIPIAEDCGLILPLGDHVIETVCRQIRAFEEAGMRIPVAVNISMQQFERPEFADHVKQVLRATMADPALLELEVTESMAMNNPEAALAHIATLRDYGVRFAIDDFGTGYSNLAQLSRLPFDVFKIDRTFVCALCDDSPAGETIVRTIIAMAHSMNYQRLPRASRPRNRPGA